VLSPSTERADRGRKFRDYQELASLEEYLLVSQFEPCVEIYRRRANGKWAYEKIRV
jgi:Uma2 family endonuclease